MLGGGVFGMESMSGMMAGLSGHGTNLSVKAGHVQWFAIVDSRSVIPSKWSRRCSNGGLCAAAHAAWG